MSGLKKEREKARDRLLGVSFPDDIFLPEPKAKALRERTETWRAMGQGLEQQVAESIQQRWRELRAAEIVLEERGTNLGEKTR